MTSTDRLFDLQDVLLDLDVHDRASLFDAVATRWAANHGVDAQEVVRGLAARESLGSTGLGQGVAIPHARSATQGRALSAFVRPLSAIDFDSPDGALVDCFVFLLVPSQAASEHLKRLGQIAAKLSSVTFRDQVRAAKTGEQIVDLFAGAPAAPKKVGE